MKHVLLLFILFFNLRMVWSQMPPPELEYSHFISYDRIESIPCDTIYYQFNNGVQMIEIREHRTIVGYQDHLFKSVGSNTYTRSIYIFRNEFGQIISKFNLFGSELNYTSLKPVDKNDKKLKVHKPRKLDDQRMERTYAVKDLAGYYAVYNSRSWQERESEKQKFGLVDSLGELRIIHILTDIKLENELYHVEGYPDGSGKLRHGLMDKHLNWIFPFEYDYFKLIDYYKKWYSAGKDGKAFILDENGKVLVEAPYQEISPYYYKAGWYNLVQDGKFGLIDDKFEMVVPCKFDRNIGEFKNGYSIAYKSTGYGVIDESGNEISEFKYTISLYALDSNYFLGRDQQNYYLIDKYGKEVCKSKMQIEKVIDEKRFIARTGYSWDNGKCGIIGRDENIILPFDYYDITHIKDDIFIAGIAGKSNGSYYFDNAEWRIINGKGEILVDQKFKSINPIHKNYFIGAIEDKKWSVFDWDGKNLLKDFYYDVTSFGDGRFMVREAAYKVFFVNLKGKEISDGYEMFSFIGSNLFRIRKGKEFFLTDSTLEIIGEMDGEYSYKTIPGAFAYRKVNSKWYVYKKGQEILQDFNIKSVDYFADNYLVALVNNHWGSIDFSGKVMIPFIYDGIVSITPEYFRVLKDEKFGLVRKDGTVILNPEFTHIDFHYNFIRVGDGKRFYFKNKDGSDVLEKDYYNMSLLYDYSDGDHSVFTVSNKDKISIVNIKGEKIIPVEFDYSGHSWESHDYYQLTENPTREFRHTRRDSIERWFLSRTGAVADIVMIENREKGFTHTTNPKETGYYRKQTLLNWYGDTVVPYKYHNIESLEKNHFIVSLFIDTSTHEPATGAGYNRNVRSYQGLIDTTGKEIIPCEYDDIDWIDTMYLRCKIKNLFCLYDRFGRKYTEVKYSGFGLDLPGLITFGIPNDPDTYQPGNWNVVKVGWMDLEGNVVVKAKYDYAWYMDPNKKLITVKRDNAIGIIDTRGGLIGEFMTGKTPKERWELYLKSGK